MTRISLMFAVLSLCVVPAGCDAGDYVQEEVIERSVEFSPGGRLVLVNVNGDISIGSWDRHEVKMKAEKRARAGSKEEALLLLEKTTVQFDRTENRIDIRTDAPKKPGRNRNVSVTYTVTVPKEIELELKSVNGSVLAKDVSGAVDAKTTNGKIKVTVSGSGDEPHDIRAATTNGGIEAGLPKGLKAHLRHPRLAGRSIRIFRLP